MRLEILCKFSRTEISNIEEYLCVGNESIGEAVERTVRSEITAKRQLKELRERRNE